MKKLVFGLLLLCASAASLTACKEADKDPQPPVTSVPLIFPQISSDPNKRFLEFTRVSASDSLLPVTPEPDPGTPPDPFRGQRPVFEFTFDIPDQRDVKIKAVQVYKSFRRGPAGRIGPRVLSGEYTSFPATVTLNSQELLTGLTSIDRDASGRNILVPVKATRFGARNRIFLGDNIIFTFEYLLEDGSTIVLTPLTPVTLAPPTGSTVPGTAYVISGTLINSPYSITARVARE